MRSECYGAEHIDGAAQMSVVSHGKWRGIEEAVGQAVVCRLA